MNIETILDDLRHAHAEVSLREVNKPAIEIYGMVKEIALDTLLMKIKDAINQAEMIKKRLV